MKTKILFIFLFISVLCNSQNDSSLAENFFRQGEYNKALLYYKKLVESNPYNSFYIKRVITCYQETDQYDIAESFILDFIEKNTSQTFWYVELGYNYDRQQKQDLAQKQYQKAIENTKIDPSLAGITGRFFRENNLLKEAVAVYELAMEINKNADFNFQLANIYGEQGNLDKMFTAYINLIDSNDAYTGTVQRYTSSYITDDPNNNYNVSFKKALLKKSISNPKIVWNQLLSWLFTKQGEYNKAFIQEKAIFKRQAESLDDLLILGKVAFENSAYDNAKSIFAYVLEHALQIDDKLESELYLLKTEIKLAPEKAESLFVEKLQAYGINSNTLSIQEEYADYVTFYQNNPEKANEILEKALTLTNSKFEKARLKLKLGDVLVFTGQFNKALIYFSQIQTELKNHPLGQKARFKVAETSFFKGDFAWSKAQLKVLKGSTSQLIANDAVNLFLIISDNEPSDSVFTGLRDFAKAKLLIYQNKKTEAATILSTVIKEYQGQNIEDEALLELAKLYRSNNQFQEAVACLSKIVDIDKTGVFVDDSYYLLAEIYKENLKDLEKASEYYQKIIFEQSSSIYLVDARKKFRQIRGDILK